MSTPARTAPDTASPVANRRLPASIVLTAAQAASATCLTCADSTQARDRYDAPRCQDCQDWLGVGR